MKFYYAEKGVMVHEQTDSTSPSGLLAGVLVAGLALLGMVTASAAYVAYLDNGDTDLFCYDPQTEKIHMVFSDEDLSTAYRITVIRDRLFYVKTINEDKVVNGEPIVISVQIAA